MENILVYIADGLYSVPIKRFFKETSNLYNAILIDDTEIKLAEGRGKLYCVKYNERSSIIQKIIVNITEKIIVEEELRAGCNHCGVIRKLKKN